MAEKSNKPQQLQPGEVVVSKKDLAPPDVVKDILDGYEAWKSNKLMAVDDASPDAYTEYYIRQQNLKTFDEVYLVASDKFHTDAEVGAEVRRLLGLADTA